MKKIFLLTIIGISATIALAQKETFDLITYAAPTSTAARTWKKEVTETATSYTTTTKNSTWCRISIIKSTVSKGSIERDFESEWQDLIVKNYRPNDTAQLDNDQQVDGWKIKSGSAKFTFDKKDAAAMLTTATGFTRCASIIIVTNSSEYLKDAAALIASVDLLKPEVSSEQVINDNSSNTSIVGTWLVSQTFNQQSKDLVVKVMGNGYKTKQYTFNNNSTYSFIAKTFMSSNDKMLLIKETGTYQISGNNITLTPQKNVAEEWSKKESVDNRGRPASVDQWGKFLSSKKGVLEKTTYKFTKHYFSGIQAWNVVLQADKQTQRDGPFSSNATFTNAWYYSPVSDNHTAIELPDGEQLTTEEVKKGSVQQTTNTNNTTLVGTWDIHASEKTGYSYNNYMISGYVNRQYTFHANGTYNFYNKTYQMFTDKMFLTKETGTYQINGASLTIQPQKSVIEAWSRQGSNDVWGKKLNTQNIALEKTTYQFSKEFIPEVNEWKLFLQADKQTKRDGNFNNNERNAWVYIISSAAHPLIKLPE